MQASAATVTAKMPVVVALLRSRDDEERDEREAIGEEFNCLYQSAGQPDMSMELCLPDAHRKRNGQPAAKFWYSTEPLFQRQHKGAVLFVVSA